jgi:hypothetical protein
MDSKPLASFSVDLDNQWSYMKTYGDTHWQDYPSYLDIFVPKIVELLETLGLKITFFIVGQDAVLKENFDAIKLLVDKGHELANHSFNHEPWLKLYNKEKIEKEILTTEQSIMRIGEEKPVGFRGPGFSWSKDLLEVLIEHGYLYDATTLPTYLGPIARAYYFRNPDLNTEDQQDRKDILGGFSEGMRPVKPYYWELTENNKLLEIPITTIPLIKTPFHMSYLLFLSRYSKLLMRMYFKFAITMCRYTHTEPSFVIHPTDLLTREQVPDMHFFPGMELTSDYKLTLLREVISQFSNKFQIVNMRCHAEAIMKKRNVNIKSL